MMNGQYLKIALRRIFRNYKSTLIIFSGLVIGLTSCLIIYTKITYELSFDSFHSNKEDIYRVVRVTSGLEYTNGGLEYRTGVHFPFPGEIKKGIPEIREVIPMFYLGGQKIEVLGQDTTNKKTFDFNDGLVLTDPSFFKVFDYGEKGIKWFKGSGPHVLDKPFAAVLTRETAGRLFLGQDPIGKDIFMFGKTFIVEGVIEDFPLNTDFPFKIIASISTFTEVIYPKAFEDWGSLSDNYQCYVLLNKNSDVKSIEKKFKDIYKPHADGDMAEKRTFKLQSLSKVHKESEYGNYNNRTVSSGLLLSISLIGAFIYLIACFNYSNFFLAESFKQRKQIALKLILGSKPALIFFQFFTEALLVNFFALFISLQLAIPILRNFNTFIDIPEGFLPAIGLPSILFILVLLILGGFLSIIFSIFNLNLRSLSALLKKSDSRNLGNENLFGKTSVILQFVVAQTVIIGTLFLVKQIYFINHENLGYNTENVILARLPEMKYNLSALTSELSDLPGIKGVSFSSVAPAENQQWSNFSIFRNNEKKDIEAELKSIDSSYLKLYSFKLIAGQNFTSKDTLASVILNREFLTETGFTNPNDVIGLKMLGMGRDGAIVKGVVEDFHSGSLHGKIRPCVFYSNPGDFRFVNIKMESSPISRKSSILPSGLNKIDQSWKRIFPNQPFEYRFLRDVISGFYISEYKAMNLFLLFAAITIFLCILGILGLSLSMNERRTKEIGLRKVNGATIPEVMILLNKNFVKWVSFAFIIACPLAFFAMHKWLQNFAYKTSLSWWVFALSGLLALVIALLTVSLQSWRAATRNPVEALRYE
ncbi:MAG: ABC transporter permease [Bacteroidales bacterium]